MARPAEPAHIEWAAVILVGGLDRPEAAASCTGRRAFQEAVLDGPPNGAHGAVGTEVACSPCWIVPSLASLLGQPLAVALAVGTDVLTDLGAGGLDVGGAQLAVSSAGPGAIRLWVGGVALLLAARLARVADAALGPERAGAAAGATAPVPWPPAGAWHGQSSWGWPASELLAR